jgi:hypothetical protein
MYKCVCTCEVCSVSFPFQHAVSVSVQSHDQTCNLVIVVVCVSEFPPFHLEVWCQVKPTYSSLNSPTTLHTCKEKFLCSNVVSKHTGEENNFVCLHVHFP